MRWFIQRLQKPRVQKVAVEDLDKLNTSLREIVSKLVALQPKKKTDWVAIAALFVSILALGLTIKSNHDDIEEKREIQAYANWQNYLSLAVSNPNQANGFDFIKGSTDTFNLADTNTRYEIRNDSLAYRRFKKYAWFVASALGSAESVNHLQPSDTSWRKTLIEALRGHEALFTGKVYDMSSYDISFRRLLRDAFDSRKEDKKKVPNTDIGD